MNEKTQSVLFGVLTFVVIVLGVTIGVSYFSRPVNEGVRIQGEDRMIEIQVDQQPQAMPPEEDVHIRVWPFVDIHKKKPR